MAKKKPTVHWTQRPENKARLHEIRMRGAKTLADRHAGKKKPSKKLSKKPSKKTPAQRAADAKRHRIKRLEAKRAMVEREATEFLATRETGVAPMSIITEDHIHAQTQAIAYTHITAWLGLYAEVNGISEPALTRWVATALLRKANR